MNAKTLAAASTALFLVACAGANYRPMIDSKNVDMSKYESDLRDCQQYAQQTSGAGMGAAVGAGAGALFGAILAAAAGSRYDQGATARVGAVTGALAGGVGGGENQESVVKRCIAGRGYSVLQ